ncbi:hypothetical protein SEVIR_5G065902v4 [Setaria viridis]
MNHGPPTLAGEVRERATGRAAAPSSPARSSAPPSPRSSREQRPPTTFVAGLGRNSHEQRPMFLQNHRCTASGACCSGVLSLLFARFAWMAEATQRAGQPPSWSDIPRDLAGHVLRLLRRTRTAPFSLPCARSGAPPRPACPAPLSWPAMAPAPTRTCRRPRPCRDLPEPPWPLPRCARARRRPCRDPLAPPTSPHWPPPRRAHPRHCRKMRREGGVRE